jgi:hypothetical protein
LCLLSTAREITLALKAIAYAEELTRAGDVAEGFIHGMAQKVAGDRKLDLEGKKRAVRNAIDIYAREIAGGQTHTNYDAIVEEALSRARSLVALIALRSRLLALATSDDERGAARTNLGNALWKLGERESGTARLEQAVAAYRAALARVDRGLRS